MAKQVWTLDAFENANVKEEDIEGKTVTIRSVDPKLLIALFGDADLAEGQKMSKEDLINNLELLDEVVINGLVEPAVTKETVSKLGRFKQPIAMKIMQFSGLTEEAGKEADEFREDTDSRDG